MAAKRFTSHQYIAGVLVALKDPRATRLSPEDRTDALDAIAVEVEGLIYIHKKEAEAETERWKQAGAAARKNLARRR